MEKTDVALLGQLVKCGTDIPLWHYDAQGELLDTDSEHLILGKILEFIGGVQYMLRYGETGTKPLILGSDMGVMWCAVFRREKDALREIFLLGPVFGAEVSAAYMEESADRYRIDPHFRGQYLKILRSISVVPRVMFLQYGLMLHCCVTGEKLQRGDIQFQPRNTVLSPIAREADRDRAYFSELRLLRLLREGDLDYKEALADSESPFRERQGEPWLQALIRTTGFTALCIREAVTAGLSPDTAYSVGEGYMESMTQCRTGQELSSVCQAMFEDLVLRVNKHRTAPDVSPQIHRCREYIELHPEQELKLKGLSEYVGYSQYHLSRKFKQEMGVSIGTYIKYVRVERAKLLLMSTGMPVAQIGEALHFASPSHFAGSFREVTGMTPQQFRKK